MFLRVATKTDYSTGKTELQLTKVVGITKIIAQLFQLYYFTEMYAAIKICSMEPVVEV